MKIVIVGAGVVGESLCSELSEEDLENNEILHGFAGSYYVKNELGIDVNILKKEW